MDLIPILSVIQILVAQILVETARFVRSNGAQVEVLLRVKQAGNPHFSFLTHGDPLNPYFRWILEANPQVRFARGACDIIDPHFI